MRVLLRGATSPKVCQKPNRELSGEKLRSSDISFIPLFKNVQYFCINHLLLYTSTLH